MIPTFQTQSQPTQTLMPQSAGSVSAGQMQQTSPMSMPNVAAMAKLLSSNPQGASPVGAQGSGMPNLQAIGGQNGASFGNAGAASQTANANANFLGGFTSPQWMPQ